MQTGEFDNEKVTPFKQAQLRHRRRGDDPNRIDDIGEWIDFSRVRNEDQRIIQLSLPDASLIEKIYKGPIFGLRDFPGFLFAPQALGEDIQKELAYRSVTEYCEVPHKTNIDQCPPKAHEEVDDTLTMWKQWKEESQRQQTLTTKKLKMSQSIPRHYRSFKKLAWATMGYHYDWTKRSYKENLKSEMPALVGGLSTIFARTSLLLQCKQSTNVSFSPTASIVNFYTTKSNMGGHRDDLELAMDKPIVSMSIGLPAVFLLGGHTKEDGPVFPILIRSGDIVCMGGDSRLNYHGMARLIPCTTTLPPRAPELCPKQENKIMLSDVECEKTVLTPEDADALDAYLSVHRININVRQVYPDDWKAYDDTGEL